jgi:hypothetical protein
MITCFVAAGSGFRTPTGVLGHDVVVVVVVDVDVDVDVVVGVVVGVACSDAPEIPVTAAVERKTVALRNPEIATMRRAQLIEKATR